MELPAGRATLMASPPLAPLLAESLGQDARFSCWKRSCLAPAGPGVSGEYILCVQPLRFGGFVLLFVLDCVGSPALLELVFLRDRSLAMCSVA